MSNLEKNTHILRYYFIDEVNRPDILLMIANAKKVTRNRYELYANNITKLRKIISIGKLSTNVFGNYYKFKSFVSNEVVEKI